MLVRRRKLVRMLMVLAMSAAAPAWAQLIVDPAALPLPDSTEPDPARAVVVSVTFNSPTEVVTNMVMVANRGARSALGAPPLILLQLLDSNDNVIAEQDAWHPLEVRDLNEGDGESLEAVESGPGTFYVPLSEHLANVRIIDTRLDMELITVDVTDVVATFCAQNSEAIQCSMFRDGFE